MAALSAYFWEMFLEGVCPSDLLWASEKGFFDDDAEDFTVREVDWTTRPDMKVLSYQHASGRCHKFLNILPGASACDRRSDGGILRWIRAGVDRVYTPLALFLLRGVRANDFARERLRLDSNKTSRGITYHWKRQPRLGVGKPQHLIGVFYHGGPIFGFQTLPPLRC